MPYFDHNATSPLAPLAREILLRAYDETWQNPSSPYRDGARVKIRVDSARERLAELIGCKPARCVFNAGATEAANDIFQYWAETLPSGIRVLINPTEHPCVIEAAAKYFPGRVLAPEIDEAGVVKLDSVRAQLSSENIGAVAVMAANNETGVIQPWGEISSLCRERRIPFLCDVTQWLGKLPADGLRSVDWAFGSAHKFGGPKGVGFLIFPEQANGFRGQRGGEQEGGHRAGTENYPGIAAMVAVLAEAEQKKVFLETPQLALRTSFEQKLTQLIPGTVIVAKSAERLWNTVSVLLPHGDNLRWVVRLDKHGVQVSTGSACATGKKGPSHVLSAMGFSPDEARRVVRISSSWETTQADWDALLEAFAQVDRELLTTPPSVIKI